MLQALQLVVFGSSSDKYLKWIQIHHKPVPIFPDYRKISCQKIKQNKSRYSQKFIKSSTRHSPSSSCDSTGQKLNVTKKNPKLNTGRESILSSTKQTYAQVDKAINQSPKHL